MSGQTTSLYEIQRWMKGQILPGHPPLGGRMAVYAEGYLVRMEEALAEAYPAVQHILGRELFSQMAHDYAVAYPSHDYNLSFTGRHLPEFLKTSTQTEKLPFLPELSLLEWFVVEAFHAFDASPVDALYWAQLSDEDWERAVFTFQPSVRCVSSTWPVLDLWHARKTPRSEIRIELINRPQHVLIHRLGESVHCALMTEPQSFFLTALLGKKSLGAACEALLSRHPGTELPIRDWFSEWASHGLITRCEVA